MGEALIHFAGGLTQGLAQSKQQAMQQEYYKALMDQNKQAAKLTEAKIKLMQQQDALMQQFGLTPPDSAQAPAFSGPTVEAGQSMDQTGKNPFVTASTELPAQIASGQMNLPMSREQLAQRIFFDRLGIEPPKVTWRDVGQDQIAFDDFGKVVAVYPGSPKSKDEEYTDAKGNVRVRRVMEPTNRPAWVVDELRKRGHLGGEQAQPAESPTGAMTLEQVNAAMAQVQAAREDRMKTPVKPNYIDKDLPGGGKAKVGINDYTGEQMTKPIETAPGGMSPADAAKSNLALIGASRVRDIFGMLFDGGDVEKGAVNWALIRSSAAPFGGFGDGRIFNNQMRAAIRSVLRPESGAVISDEEIDGVVSTYIPSMADDMLGFGSRDKIVRKKMMDFQEYVVGLAALTDPNEQIRAIRDGRLAIGQSQGQSTPKTADEYLKLRGINQ